MEDYTIPELTPASALAGTEKLPAAQDSADVFITPSQLKTYVLNGGLSALLQINNNTGNNTINFHNQTANRVPILNGSKDLVSSAVSTTTFNYIANLTSDVQAQLNALSTGVSWKDAVRGAIDSNVALNGTVTRNGVAFIDGDRAVVIANTDQTENGIWIVRGGLWERAADFDDGATDKIASCVVPVEEGDYAEKAFICSNDNPVIVGTDNITFNNWGGTTYAAGSYLSLIGNIFNIDFSTFSTAQITEGANKYFTEARAIASKLAGYTAGAGTINSADSIIGALQKLHGNLNIKADISPTVGSGTVVSFDIDRDYGSEASPETGNISYSTTGAKVGVISRVIHNNGTAPTYAANMQPTSFSAPYLTGSVNYIVCEYRSSTLVKYTVHQ